MEIVEVVQVRAQMIKHMSEVILYDTLRHVTTQSHGLCTTELSKGLDKQADCCDIQ